MDANKQRTCRICGEALDGADPHAVAIHKAQHKHARLQELMDAIDDCVGELPEGVASAARRLNDVMVLGV